MQIGFKKRSVCEKRRHDAINYYKIFYKNPSYLRFNFIYGVYGAQVFMLVASEGKYKKIESYYFDDCLTCEKLHSIKMRWTRLDTKDPDNDIYLAYLIVLLSKNNLSAKKIYCVKRSILDKQHKLKKLRKKYGLFTINKLPEFEKNE